MRSGFHMWSWFQRRLPGRPLGQQSKWLQSGSRAHGTIWPMGSTHKSWPDTSQTHTPLTATGHMALSSLNETWSPPASSRHALLILFRVHSLQQPSPKSSIPKSPFLFQLPPPGGSVLEQWSQFSNSFWKTHTHPGLPHTQFGICLLPGPLLLSVVHWDPVIIDKCAYTIQALDTTGNTEW